jgi:hypothetical protein
MDWSVQSWGSGLNINDGESGLTAEQELEAEELSKFSESKEFGERI